MLSRILSAIFKMRIGYICIHSMRLKKPQTKHIAKLNRKQKNKTKLSTMTKAKTVNLHKSLGSLLKIKVIFNISREYLAQFWTKWYIPQGLQGLAEVWRRRANTCIQPKSQLANLPKQFICTKLILRLYGTTKNTLIINLAWKLQINNGCKCPYINLLINVII